MKDEDDDKSNDGSKSEPKRKQSTIVEDMPEPEPYHKLDEDDEL